MKHFLLLHYIKLQAFLRKEDGASAIEYAIIAGLIAVGIIAAVGTLEGGITTLFKNIGNELSTAAENAGGAG